MSELSEKKTARGSVSLPHLGTVIIGMIAIILGLTNEDFILNYAVFGPLIIFSIGAFILMVLIESRHNTSDRLDIFILTIIGASSSQDKRTTRNLISLGFTALSLQFAIISIFFLAQFNQTGFGLTLLFSLIFMGLTVGRIIDKAVGEKSSIISWPQMDPKERILEIAALGKWLKGRERLSQTQEKKIAEQKMKFRDRMLSILDDNNKSNAMLSSLDEIEDVEEIIVGELRSEYTDWLDESMDVFSHDSNLKDSLLSLLLLPMISELLGHLARHDIGSDVLFNRLLSLVGKYAIRLDCVDIFDHDVRLSANLGISDGEGEPDLQRFVRLVSVSAAKHEQFTWSPWWILNLRFRMNLLMTSPEWSGIESSDFGGVDSLEISNNFDDWCFIISEFDSLRQDEDSDISNSLQTILKKIKSSSRGLPINDVLKVTWLASNKLRKER